MPEDTSSHAQRFGAKLRELRHRRNISAKQLAEALGYQSKEAMTMIETGKRNPSVQLVVKASLYFGVSTDVLLRDDLELDPPDESGVP